MELSVLAGNSRLKERLSQREEGRGLSHAYIISGPAGSGRHTLGRLLAAAMVCTAPPAGRPCGRCAACKKVFSEIHPDVNAVIGEKDGKPISVDQIRTLRADAHIRPNEGERKVYLLEQADQMNASAQNAMLKLLEEGPRYAAFLLLCENAGGLLQTVRSRCEELTLSPVPLGECRSWLRTQFPEESEARVEQAALECQGILGRAAERLKGADERTEARKKQAAQLADAIQGEEEAALFEASMALDQQNRDELVRLLDQVEEILGSRLAQGAGRRRLLHGIELVKQLRAAARLNANPGQLAGWLCAGMFLNER